MDFKGWSLLLLYIYLVAPQSWSSETCTQLREDFSLDTDCLTSLTGQFLHFVASQWSLNRQSVLARVGLWLLSAAHLIWPSPAHFSKPSHFLICSCSLSSHIWATLHQTNKAAVCYAGPALQCDWQLTAALSLVWDLSLLPASPLYSIKMFLVRDNRKWKWVVLGSVPTWILWNTAGLEGGGGDEKLSGRRCN